MQLTPQECRVLGVLVEKAQTVQSQYPLTLNAVVSGANQKNNRDPVVTFDEDDALTALDGLRAKGLVREVMLSGSRVAKFKHDARERLGIGTPELVVLAELMLRGPQTIGEIRSRASRMHPLESTDVVASVLETLAAHDPPLIEHVAPAPGSRAGRAAQRLCPGLHPTGPAVAAPSSSAGGAAPATPGRDATPRLESTDLLQLVDRLERLEQTVARLLDLADSLDADLAASARAALDAPSGPGSSGGDRTAESP